MDTYTALLPFSEIKGKKDTGRDIKAASLKEAKIIAIKIYGKSVKVIPPYKIS